MEGGTRALYFVVMATTRVTVSLACVSIRTWSGNSTSWLARSSGPDRILIAQAVREFVEREYASLLAVRESESDIEAGRTLEGDGARAWFEDLKKGGAAMRATSAGRGRVNL